MKKRTADSFFAFFCLFALLAVFTAGTICSNAYGAEKQPGEIIKGKLYYQKPGSNIKGCDVVTYIELGMFPYGMGVQTPSGTAVNVNTLIPDSRIKYKFHRDDRMFTLIEEKDPSSIGYNDPTRNGIQIKKAGKIVVTVTKPATRTEEEITEDVTITVVDKRWPTRITGVKSKYVKKYRDKAFTLNAKCWNYSYGLKRYVSYEGWNKLVKKGDALAQELYRYPSFKSSNPKVATVDSKGRVRFHKRGKTVITIKVRLQKQYNWGDIDGDPGRYRNIPATRKVTVIVR